MTIVVQNHPYHYQMENVCRLFFPQEKIRVVHEPQPAEVDTIMQRGEEDTLLTARVFLGGQEQEASRAVPNRHPDYRAECERKLAEALFELLCGYTGFTPKWGMLTGVRPIKLMRSLVADYGEEEAARYFRERLMVSEEKTRLALRTLRHEDAILKQSRPESFSLYVSIPFCPTRCAYCSFVSQSVEKSMKLIPDYVRRLCVELRDTARIAKALGLRLESVYFGGGTPTVLTAEQLDEVLHTVNRSFDMSTAREFTVEAGRPDTITPEKLAVLKAAGVGRISINPQTMDDRVLERIGRRHTAAQTVEAFSMAREAGFQNINMDLIAGLPGDTAEGFEQTMQKVLALDPESVTVHTLALKRAAFLNQTGEMSIQEPPADKMVSLAGQMLTEAGHIPYYLYRQSRTAGNLENTGWSKPGHESFYNVFIMDETHTILAAGAGGVTKLRDPSGPNIERIFNFKFAYEYLSRFEETLDRKKKVFAFYEQYGFSEHDT